MTPTQVSLRSGGGWTWDLRCQKNAGVIARHAAINDIIRRACATVQIPAILEPSGILRNNGKRPDGASLMPWSKGKCLLWDTWFLQLGKDICTFRLQPILLESPNKCWEEEV
jgi:hypothetical protein